MNTIVAESLDYFATKLEKATGGNQKLNAAVQKLLHDIIKENETIIFNGDGYSADWHQEAAKRGLLNLKTAVDALPVLDDAGSQSTVRQVRRALASANCRAGCDIYLEQYCKTVRVEAHADAGDGPDADLPGGDSLSERAGFDLRQSEAGRLRVRYRHAR